MAYFTAEYLSIHIKSTLKNFDGRWHPCRPVNYQCDTIWHRLYIAWQVFIGKMDAVKWYKQ